MLELPEGTREYDDGVLRTEGKLLPPWACGHGSLAPTQSPLNAK